MNMKITGMTTRILGIDAAPWFGSDPIPADIPPVWMYALTVIHTDEGIDGWTMGYGANGEGRGTAYQLHDVFLPFIRGKNPLHTERMWQEMMNLNRHLYPISDGLVGMLDVAFWDIRGKTCGQSIAQMLGVYRDRVPSYRTGSHYNHTPELVYAEARQMKTEGYRGYKMTFFDGPAYDIPRLRAAREAVGAEFPLMLDCVSNYSFTQALDVGHELEQLGFHWFEEPIPDRQFAMLKRLSD